MDASSASLSVVGLALFETHWFWNPPSPQLNDSLAAEPATNTYEAIGPEGIIAKAFHLYTN